MGLFTKVAAKIPPVVKQGAKDAQQGKQNYAPLGRLLGRPDRAARLSLQATAVPLHERSQPGLALFLAVNDHRH
jgi:hypothetical protein